ncbi:hypothetical protein [Streptomyces subrutilus]|uniref:Uncharacterized protein n=1 Tax=Streptomyces subrutilus TaxID=36818 RepID=A0A1E5PSN2_9ACTN|nr:hypothetical protein [Streptomyces subrutilus]OEJ32575.1 hypothetical protein BGK67_15675 [Streptomyces subrutilus]
MSPPPPTPTDPAWEARRRRDGIAAFLTGVTASFAFFAFFPGLPHVIDWGAIIVSVAVGGLVRWMWLAHVTKRELRGRESRK